MQQSEPLGLAAPELAALEGRTAGDDHRPGATVERAGNLGRLERVEPELDQVGLPGGAVARLSQGREGRRPMVTQI